MSGQYYLLNALWFGAALYIIGRYLPLIWRIVSTIILCLLPHGIVWLIWIVSGFIKGVRAHMDEAENDNVTKLNLDTKKD